MYLQGGSCEIRQWSVLIEVGDDGQGRKIVRIIDPPCRTGVRWSLTSSESYSRSSRRRSGCCPALHVGSSCHVTGAAYSCEGGWCITQLQYLLHFLRTSENPQNANFALSAFSEVSLSRYVGSLSSLFSPQPYLSLTQSSYFW